MHADGSLQTVDTRSVPRGRRLAGHRPRPDRRGARPARAAPGAAGRAPASPSCAGRWSTGAARSSATSWSATASVLGAFAPDELLELGGGRPVWVSLDGDDVPELAARSRRAPARARRAARARAGAGRGRLRARARRLRGRSPLLEHCGIVKVATADRDDDELRALIAEPAERGLVLVATGVATADEFTRCRVLGFSHFQGEFFARPRGERQTASARARSPRCRRSRELTATDASFEELERIIGADVGLSIALLRHVNSAFFALPRKIDTVREALTLLGTRAVRRWATVVALSSVPEAPDQLVALALLRARMCELLGGATERGGARPAVHRRAVLGRRRAARRADGGGARDAAVLRGDHRRAAARRGPARPRSWPRVLRYEQGHFPDGAEGDPIELARRLPRRAQVGRRRRPLARLMSRDAAAVQAHAGVHRA